MFVFVIVLNYLNVDNVVVYGYVDNFGEGEV